MSAIKAIETQYKGYRFRSRLEARWAVYFDSAGIAWNYEPEGYTLRDGTNYLPDFWIPSWNSFVEVKPGETKVFKINQDVYLAGKMNTEWRRDVMHYCNPFHCTNPFVVSHEVGYAHSGREIVGRSLAAIEYSDILFAYISSLDCFGTIAEIGYASAKGVNTYVAIDRNCIELADTGGHGFFDPSTHSAGPVEVVGHSCVDRRQEDNTPPTLTDKGELGECWFAALMANEKRDVSGVREAAAWLNEIIPSPCNKDEQKSMQLAQQTGKNVVMLRNIPESHLSAKVFRGGSGAVQWLALDDYLSFSVARSARFEFNR